MAPTLSALLRSEDPDPSEVLQAANAVLRQDKGETAAQQAKLVALLKLDRFNDAVEFAESSGKSLRDAAAVEYAYALYKVGKLDKATEVVRGSDELGARHLEAQLSYNAEDFEHAWHIYEDLWENEDDAKEGDLRVNRGAVNAQMQWSNLGDVPSLATTREDMESFMSLYNAACISLAKGEIERGKLLLKQAKRNCSLADDLSEEEKKSEMLPMTVQELYALSMQGDSAGIEELISELSISEIPELSTRQIAQVNRLAIGAKPSNPYLAQRVLEALPALPPSEKLFTTQSSRMRQNRVALNLLVSKFQAAANATNPQPVSSSSVAIDINSVTDSTQHAAAKAQNQLGKMGIDAINKLRLKDEGNVGFVLVLVQLYILTKNHGAAISVLEGLMKYLESNKSADSSESSLHDIRFAPGLIAVLVSLYNIENRQGHIQRELRKAATYWKRKQRPQSRLFNAAGVTLLASGRPDDLKQAGEIFAASKASNSKDVVASAGYVASLATSDHSKVVDAAKQILSVEKLTAGIDASALDSAGIPQLKAASKASKQKRAVTADAEKPAKKRFRKSRLPKDYDPEKKPDPERWLPLRDRSTYKPKGKKGKQKQQALTQGGISKDGADDGASDAAKTSVVKGPSGGGAGKNKKSKKKK